MCVREAGSFSEEDGGGGGVCEVRGQHLVCVCHHFKDTIPAALAEFKSD